MSGFDLPKEGEEVEIRIEAVKTFGSVVWVDGRECGIAFESPLMPVEVDALRSQANLTKFLGMSVEDRVALEQWLVGSSR